MFISTTVNRCTMVRTMISCAAWIVFSAGRSLAADAFPCEDLIRHMEKGGIDTNQANLRQSWSTYLDAMEIIAPDGQSEKDTMSYRMSGEVDVGSALVATIRFVDKGGSPNRAVRSMPIRGRWIAPTPMSVDGGKSQCAKEDVENVPLNVTVDFKLTLKNQDDLKTSKGKWLFVLYTENRTVLQFAEYDLRPLPTAQEKKERWLADAYMRYLLLDKCVDLYVASLSKREYRAAMSAIEAEGKRRGIDTDSVWKRVNEDGKEVLEMWSGFVASRGSLGLEQRSSLRDLCGSSSRLLMGQAQELQPAGSAPKKDF